ncbi:MAG: hypothetical protein KKD30_05415 [Gammaproteobacteria bacterium]|nr:hypothetical protein [Gammaproteobacteria bacterium]MBU1859379.1 hypothetical protein [Gammaproteobacteria bacterium]
MDDNGIGNVISRTLEKAAQATGVLTGLITISALGFSTLTLAPAEAAALAVGVFGTVGAMEVFHRQRKAEAIERSQAMRPASNERLLLDIVVARPEWQAKLFKQLNHGGLKWNAVGFEQIPAPVAVTGPLCPTCGSHLAERFKVGFPGRMRITLLCDCGFTKNSRYFLHELKSEAHKLAGALTD